MAKAARFIALVLLHAAVLGHAATDAAAAPCPVPGPAGAGISATGSFLRMAHEVQVVAGGRLPLEGCEAVPGHGHVPAAAQVNLALTETRGRTLALRTKSECDTVLLVAAATGTWRFDDDGTGGADALVRIEDAPAGSYDIWVGTFDTGTCRARLMIQTTD